MEIINNKKQLIEEWIRKNGACDINLKEKVVRLLDGGLFSIEVKKIKRRKVVGYKKLPNGNTEIIFAKKATIPGFDYSAYVCFEDIEDIIRYLTRLKNFLKKLNYKTDLR